MVTCHHDGTATGRGWMFSQICEISTFPNLEPHFGSHFKDPKKTALSLSALANP